MHYRIIHIATSLALYCVYGSVNPNVVGFNKDTGYPDRVWELVDSGKGDDFFYICSDYCAGNCLGSFHPASDFDVIGTENRSVATDLQLLWYYNRTAQTINSAEAPSLRLTAVSASKNSVDYRIPLLREPFSYLQRSDQQFKLLLS